MRRIALIFAAISALWISLPATGQVPPTMPPNTVLCRLGVSAGPPQVCTFAQLLSQIGPAFGAVNVHQVYGVQCDGTTNDTTAISNAFSQGAGQNLIFPPGICITDPQTISQTNANAPQSIIAYGTTFRARASSASPTLTIEDVQGLLLGFTIYGLTLDAHSLHAYPLKIHGLQFGRFQNMEATGGTAGGIWLSGEPGFGIYYTTFDSVYSHNNAVGAGWIMKSINNTGQYYIAGNNFIGVRSISNGNYGYDLDYASVGIYNSEAESNATCGFNIDHAIQVDIASTHIEANNGTACAFTTTANTNNLVVAGGRTIGSITASALTNSSNSFLTADSSANPVRYKAPASTVRGNNTGSAAAVTDLTVAQMLALLKPGTFTVSASVNFNAGNTDTSFTITLPTGFTRYRVLFVAISGASQTLTTATAGLFTASGGGGTAIVTAASAISVSTASETTNNNLQLMTVNNLASESYVAGTLFFRVATPQGAAATGTVQLTIQPLS